MSDEDDIILSELDDEELVQQMFDDLYDGLKEEIEEGVLLPAAGKFSHDQSGKFGVLRKMKEPRPEPPLEPKPIEPIPTSYPQSWTESATEFQDRFYALADD